MLLGVYAFIKSEGELVAVVVVVLKKVRKTLGKGRRFALNGFCPGGFP